MYGKHHQFVLPRLPTYLSHGSPSKHKSNVKSQIFLLLACPTLNVSMHVVVGQTVPKQTRFCSCTYNVTYCMGQNRNVFDRSETLPDIRGTPKAVYK